MKRICSHALLVIIAFFAFSSSTHASTSDNLAGWAWSSTIGWISFNCTNTDPSDAACSTSGYGVNLGNDGSLTGYAWSSSIGWIKFGGLSGFPTGAGTSPQNAAVVNGKLIGWVKALSADNTGWDGWISLSGSNYGVIQSGSSFMGYGWGSSVIGWVLFDVSSQDSACTDDCDPHQTGGTTFDIQDAQNPGVSISGATIPYNARAVLSWTIDNLPGVSCSVSKKSQGGTDFSTLTGITESGSTTSSPLVAGTYTFGLDCSNPSSSSDISFTVAPQAATFSLGGDEGIHIQVGGAGTSQSEQDTTFVYAEGGYSSPVDIYISAYPTAPASTTLSYSLDGGNTYWTSPTNASPKVTVSNYTQGVPFKMKIVRAADATVPIKDPFTITLTAVGSDSSHITATKRIIVTPATFNPSFQER